MQLYIYIYAVKIDILKAINLKKRDKWNGLEG